MEVESPPDKSDLVRLRDAYGRQGRAYEGREEHSDDLERYEFVAVGEAAGAAPVRLRGVEMSTRNVAGALAAADLGIGAADLVVPCSGVIEAVVGGEPLARPGMVVSGAELMVRGELEAAAGTVLLILGGVVGAEEVAR
jgi:hypothetical protein